MVVRTVLAGICMLIIVSSVSAQRKAPVKAQESTEKEYYPGWQLKLVYHNGQFNGVGIRVGADSLFSRSGKLSQTIYHDNFKDRKTVGGHATWTTLISTEFYADGKVKLKSFQKSCYECGECPCGTWQWFNKRGKRTRIQNIPPVMIRNLVKTSLKATTVAALIGIIPCGAWAQANPGKVFNQCDPNCIWNYYHPFTDSSYVFAVQDCGEEFANELTGDAHKGCMLYFGKDNGSRDRIFWKWPVSIRAGGTDLRQEDFNGDGVPDLKLFTGTGGRGSNEFYFLILVDRKKHVLTQVKGFDQIANPVFNKKHNVIIGYGYSGENYYSIYRISDKNQVYQIGGSFKDDLMDDPQKLNRKIEQLLNIRK